MNIILSERSYWVQWQILMFGRRRGICKVICCFIYNSGRVALPMATFLINHLNVNVWQVFAQVKIMLR